MEPREPHSQQTVKCSSSGVPRNFFGEGGGGGEFQQIQLRTKGRKNGDLGAVAPYSGVPLNLQVSETRIVTDVFSTELGICLIFVKTSEFRGEGR
jgi:hypothetical protein